MGEPSERWTEGVHHVGLTVPNLGAALRFFTKGLGMKQVGEVASYPAASGSSSLRRPRAEKDWA